MKVLGKEGMEESTFIKSEVERGGGTYKQWMRKGPTFNERVYRFGEGS
jgi:hypothetical protein